MNFATIILAAGKGTRMKSDLPKVMHEIAHKPIINWVTDASIKAKSNKILTVVSEDFKSKINSELVIQKQRLGTGHAVLQCKDSLQNYNGHIVILVGDVPLITSDTIKELISQLEDFDIAVAGLQLQDPTGYGRLIIKHNKLIGIIEQKDANKSQQEINIVNSGIIAVKSSDLLFKLLGSLSTVSYTHLTLPTKRIV